MRIYFDEATHRYTNEKGQRYISVTQFLKKFQPPYKREHWLRVKSVEKLIPAKDFKKLKETWISEGNHYLDSLYPEFLENELMLNFPEVRDYYDEAYDYLVKLWEQSREEGSTKGTARHKKKELDALTSGILTNPATGTSLPVIACGDESLTDHLSQLKPGHGYTEVILEYTFPRPIWDPDPDVDEEIAGIAGQEDALLLHAHAEALDYKTDEKIDLYPIKWKNYNPRPGKDYGFEYWAFPIDAPDSTFFKYQMQVSLYSLMLDLAGWSIGPQHILHLQPNKENVIEIPYLRNQAAAALSYYYWLSTKEQLYFPELNR